MTGYIRDYMEDLSALARDLDGESLAAMIGALEGARRAGGRIFVFGNGGSAAHANHFAGDLGKNVTRREAGRFQVFSLCGNMTVLTAYANDLGYDSVFCEQLKNHGLQRQDLILAISASGNSPNVIRACAYAKERGARILSLTGFTGGKLRELSDLCLHIPRSEYEKVEDLHMAALHIMVSYFKRQEAAQ